MAVLTEARREVPTGTWMLDPVHSTIGFELPYMAGTFRGQFRDVGAKLTADSLRGSARVASIDVKDENLVAHLQSPEFFDADRHPELTFASPVHLAAVFRDGAQVAGLAFLALAIQHWVSLRWRSFPIATATGIIAIVVSYVMIASSRDGGWPQYFPWALPMLVMSKPPRHIEPALWIGAAAGLLISAAGCADFCRREVK